MAENQRPLSDFISSVEQVDAPNISAEDLGEKPKTEKSKVFPVIVGILLVLILGMGGYYVYKQYFAPDSELLTEESNSDDSITSLLEGNFPVKELAVVKILDEVEGDFNSEDGTCDDIDSCVANIKVAFIDNSRVSEEFVIENISFYHKFTGLEEVSDNLADTDLSYYLLTYGSSNEQGAYLIDNQGYVSKSFCTTYSNLYILWDENYLIFTDCGGSIGSEYSEVISGISVLNLESGEVTQIVTPIRGSDNQTEISYDILDVDYTNGILTLNECQYSEAIDECNEKEIDLTGVDALK